MFDWLSFVPITVVVAIGVFAIKETFELLRRRSGDARRVRGLKALLARECELNYWAIKSFRRILNEIPTQENNNWQMRVTIEKTGSGRPFAKVVSDDGGIEAHYGIPQVHRELMSKFLLDVATLDKDFFEILEPAFDAVAELEHIRESLVSARYAPEDIGQDGYLEGFAGYALNEIKDAEMCLANLYVYCTGQALTKHRLR